MFRRLLALAAGAAGCYSAPEPDCGFACGPNNACPADYACAADRHCHRNGTPDSLVCGTTAPDGGTDTGPGPHVLTTEPANNTTGVAVDVHPTAVLDQAIVVFLPSDVSMTDASDTAVPGMAEVSADAMSLQYFPNFQLAANQRYTVAVDSGVVTTGGTLGAFTWSFTTGADNIAPRIVGILPAPGSTDVNVATAVAIEFDEMVQGVDTTSFTVTTGGTPVAGTISMNGSYVFEPVAPLPSATTYTVELTPAIHDAAGNALTDYSFMFTTQ